LKRPASPYPASWTGAKEKPRIVDLLVRKKEGGRRRRQLVLRRIGEGGGEKRRKSSRRSCRPLGENQPLVRARKSSHDRTSEKGRKGLGPRRALKPPWKRRQTSSVTREKRNCQEFSITSTDIKKKESYQLLFCLSKKRGNGIVFSRRGKKRKGKGSLGCILGRRTERISHCGGVHALLIPKGAEK